MLSQFSCYVRIFSIGGFAKVKLGVHKLTGEKVTDDDIMGMFQLS